MKCPDCGKYMRKGREWWICKCGRGLRIEAGSREREQGEKGD